MQQAQAGFRPGSGGGGGTNQQREYAKALPVSVFPVLYQLLGADVSHSVEQACRQSLCDHLQSISPPLQHARQHTQDADTVCRRGTT